MVALGPRPYVLVFRWRSIKGLGMWIKAPVWVFLEDEPDESEWQAVRWV